MRISLIVLTVWAATIISPLEMVRTKMQSEQLTYRAVATAVEQTVRNNGFGSLWRGLGPTLLRDVPFSGVAMMAMMMIDG
jgi:solute carrier family 25 protein 39/40